MSSSGLKMICQIFLELIQLKLLLFFNQKDLMTTYAIYVILSFIPIYLRHTWCSIYLNSNCQTMPLFFRCTIKSTTSCSDCAVEFLCGYYITELKPDFQFISSKIDKTTLNDQVHSNFHIEKII